MQTSQPSISACFRMFLLFISVGLMAIAAPVAPASGWIQEEEKSEKSASEKSESEEAGHEEGEGSHEESGHEHAEGEEHDDDHAHGDDHAEVSNFDYFLSQDHLMSHTQDSDHFSIPSFRVYTKDNENGFTLFGNNEDSRKYITIPQISPWSDEKPLMKEPEGELSQFVGRITFQPTKFIVLELMAAIFVFFLFVWLAKKIQNGDAPKGRAWNALESCIMFVRDEIAKPSIGSHDYKYFVPFLLTTFFFILTMNLMGMFPMFGTPTSNISITASLALTVFGVVLFTGSKKLGLVGFWKAQAPHIDLDGWMKRPLTFGIWCIEVFGLFIKHMVLAVRLFANMFAGHLVLAVLVGFIGAMWGTYMNWIVIPGAMGSSLALNLLELLVAFIQAYVFTFLTALFIGAAVHPH